MIRLAASLARRGPEHKIVSYIGINAATLIGCQGRHWNLLEAALSGELPASAVEVLLHNERRTLELGKGRRGEEATFWDRTAENKISISFFY